MGKNEKCDIETCFDDTLKADNYILSIVSRANAMIGWLIRNFISREANGFKKFIKPELDFI